jgi:hypothetical protein
LADKLIRTRVARGIDIGAALIVEKSRPVLAKKIVYYKDRAFRHGLPPAEVPVLEISHALRNRSWRRTCGICCEDIKATMKYVDLMQEVQKQP